MKTILIALFICVTFLSAAENYSEMSTQELIAIMGYVKQENQKDFEKELKARFESMTEAEQKQYLDNLKRLEQK